jgi:phosphoglycolate phosphatase-like HAD superfamily hydrolase
MFDACTQVGICSAATKGGFDKLVNAIVGKERLSKLDVVMAGDDVKKKKPDPMIYNMAKEKINLPSERYCHCDDVLVLV